MIKWDEYVQVTFSDNPRAISLVLYNGAYSVCLFVCLSGLNFDPGAYIMTYYIPLDAEFYGAGFYNIFKSVRITGRTLLSENRTLVEKMKEKNSVFGCYFE